MRGKLLFGAASAALIALSGAAFAQESDAGGDTGTRARFTVGQTTAAEIAPEGDQDWYRVRLEQGQRYAFTLVGVPDDNGVALDPMLGIYDSDGNQLAFNDDDGGSLNSALTYAPSTSGDYFVAASGFADQSVGRYELNASASEAPADDVGNDRNTRGRVTPGRDVTARWKWKAMSTGTGCACVPISATSLPSPAPKTPMTRCAIRSCACSTRTAPNLASMTTATARSIRGWTSCRNRRATCS
ncbi:MAG: hypothetical protein R3C16_05060 [Hyphomonadaceae bacterium]